MAADVRHPVGEVPQHPAPDPFARDGGRLDQGQHGDDGDEGEGVEEEGPGRAEAPQHQAPDGGAQGPGPVELGRVQGDGVEQVLPGHEVGEEGLPGRHGRPEGQAASGHEHDHQGRAAAPGDPHGPQAQRQQPLHGVADDEHPAAIQALGQGPGHRSDQQAREELGEGGQAQPQGAVGEAVEDDVGHGDVLHPRADVGHQGARPEQGEVPGAEGGDGVGEPAQ